MSPKFKYLPSRQSRICFVTAQDVFFLNYLQACCHHDIHTGLCVIMNTSICSSVGKHLHLTVLTLQEHFVTLSAQT